MPDGQTAAADAARLKRLPSRRQSAHGTAAAVDVRRRTRAALPAAALALVLVATFAPLPIVGDVARAFEFAGALVAVGAGVFALVVHDGARAETLDLRRVTLAAALAAVSAAAVALVVEVATVADRGWVGAADPAAAGLVARSGYCGGVAALTLGLGLIAWGAYHSSDTWTVRLLGGLGVALTCLSFVLTGHEASHGFAVKFGVVLHVLAASIWAGGLVGLGITLRARRRASDLLGGALVVKRFSILMSSTIAVLIVAGTALSWLILGSPARLVTTGYGLVLTAKIVLALSVLAVARFNHTRLVPAIARGDGASWRLLARTVAVEQVALIVIVGLTAVLVNLDPGS